MNWRRYLSILKITFREATAYRLDAVTILGSSVVFLVLYYAIWSAIDASGTLASSLNEVMTYLVAGQVISNAAFLQTEVFIGDRIRRGTIVNELKRPVGLMAHTYCHELGWVLFNSLTKALPVAVLGYLFFNTSFPGPVNGLVFVLSVFLSFNMVFLFAYSTAMLVFWTKVDWSIRMMRNTLTNLFSGVLFPLYLLPPDIKAFFDLLPFQSMVDGPVQIFMMRATGMEALKILGKQLAWIAVFAVLASLAWRKARTKLTVQGG